jgi:hypothetical protein
LSHRPPSPPQDLVSCKHVKTSSRTRKHTHARGGFPCHLCTWSPLGKPPSGDLRWLCLSSSWWAALRIFEGCSGRCGLLPRPQGTSRVAEPPRPKQTWALPPGPAAADGGPPQLCASRLHPQPPWPLRGSVLYLTAFFFLLVVLGFELRAYTLNTPPALFCVGFSR